MSGLGKVKSGDGTFLVIAGGFIWDKKQGKEHDCYAEQDYEKQDKSTGTRTGAQYGDLTGRVTKVAFRTHPEYGESINVSFLAGGENYIISISTNNRYSQDMMKALLVMDLEKTLVVKPYDFIGSDKKRAQGISFKQDGEKLSLKVEVPETHQRDEAWFKKSDKKQIKRFFEDLNEWFVAEVEEKVVPFIKAVTEEESEEEEGESEAKKKNIFEKKNEERKAAEESKKAETKVEETETKVEEKAKVTPLAMKKVLRAYISENYEGETLPDLNPEDLVKWYQLALEVEELPFDDLTGDKEGTEDAPEGELSQDELDSQLNQLMDN